MTAETTPINNQPPTACGGACTQSLDIDFSMAFQPVVDIADGSVWAYEALVRGMKIDQPNHMWAMDITSISMARGFVSDVRSNTRKSI